MTITETIAKNRTSALPEGRISLGVTKINDNQVQICVWQPKEKDCKLCLYKGGKLYKKMKMTAMSDIGMEDIFTILLEGDGLTKNLQDMEYDFLVAGEHRMDPYARLVSGREKFGRKHGKIRAGFLFDEFDWENEKWQHIQCRDMIMYEIQVRSFTRHKSAGVKCPGTFQGIQEKIPYLKKLGVNTLFLLPVYEFEEWMKDEQGQNTEKINCWGYGTDAYYFAPKRSFSGSANAGNELKELIKSLHQNGMNIILDFYFTGRKPSFIVECLRYYALHYHIDGFRINQDCMDTSCLKDDPVLSHIMIAGNSWDNMFPDSGREKMMEMNDGFLVDARRFLKSDEGQTELFYRRFKEQKKGTCVVHYITSHNGFTLRDMISYDVKHNEANGERNMDGTEYNYSWNCGYEGPTRRKAVLTMRRRQERNAFVMLLLGMAVPMLLAGDEFGRSQKGNNNAYCIDDATTWLDWSLIDKNKETFAFVKQLIRFRKKHELYHQKTDLLGIDVKGTGSPDVSCHGREPWVADFSYYSRELSVLYDGTYYGGNSLYFAFNFHWDSHEFYLPDLRENKVWQVRFDTAESGVKEIKNGEYCMQPRSIVVFEEKNEDA